MLLYVPHPAPRSSPAGARVQHAAEDELRRAVLAADARRAVECLERGVDGDAEDARGRNTLHCAIFAGHRTQVALLSALLASGADPYRQDDDGMTPLAAAVARDERRLVNALLDLGIELDHRLGGGRSMLHVAARSGSARAIDLLVARGLDPDVRCLRGRTPLHEAAGSRASYAHEAIRALIDRGADPNARDRFGWTPLHAAAVNPYGGTALAELLVERGAQALPDRGGRLPSDLATGESLTAAVQRAPRGVATPLDPLPEPARHPGLEDAIHAAPGDAEPWSVYADWLASEGDPRAELIQLGLAVGRARGKSRDRLRRELRLALEDRQFELLGELQRIDATIAARPSRAYGFEHGFLTRLDHRGTVTTLRAILITHAARFLTHLSAPGAQSVVGLLRSMGSSSLASLALAMPAPPLDASLAAALPRVRRLDLGGILPRSIVWPGLEALTFVGQGVRADGPSHLDAELPDLRHLRLVVPEARDRPRLLALARASLPRVTTLGFVGPAEAFREIAHAEWFGRIERIEPIRVGAEALGWLERIIAELPQLERIRIVAPRLSLASKRALADRLSALGPKVRVS